MRPWLRWVAATWSHHAGCGEPHDDLFLAAGARCLTLRFEGGRWRAQAPHRRRYLAYSGPVGGGRGTVQVRWRGRARLWRAAGGWLLELADRCGAWRLRLEDGGIVRPPVPRKLPPCRATMRSPTPAPSPICRPPSGSSGARSMPPPSRRR